MACSNATPSPAPKEATPEKAAPKQAALEEATLEEATPKQATPKQAAPKQAAPAAAEPVAPAVPTDVPGDTGPFSIALTSDRRPGLADWGGGLGVVVGALFWVIEPGGRVVEIFAGNDGSTWEYEVFTSEFMSTDYGGVWPGALLRSYSTDSTRASSVEAQERWNGKGFTKLANSDEFLQWTHRQPIPWRSGHAIALQTWFSNADVMEELYVGEDEQQSAAQRKLSRKVDRLLDRAVPKLVMVAAQAVESPKATWELFEPGTAKAEPAKAVEQAAAPSELPKLPGEPEQFLALADGTVVIRDGNDLWSWKPEASRWTAIERPVPPSEQTYEHLYADPAGELLMTQCKRDPSAGALWRRSGSAWSSVSLPTPTCVSALAVARDGSSWIISNELLWRRVSGDARPWEQVQLPAPWEPRDAIVFDGQVWIVAEDETKEADEDMAGELDFDEDGQLGHWAVMVDRPVPTPRVLYTES